MRRPMVYGDWSLEESDYLNGILNKSVSERPDPDRYTAVFREAMGELQYEDEHLVIDEQDGFDRALNKPTRYVRVRSLGRRDPTERRGPLAAP
jgi:hypothetical protein